MKQAPHRLMAVMLVALLAQVIVAPFHAYASQGPSAARLGAEIGILSAAGASTAAGTRPSILAGELSPVPTPPSGKGELIFIDPGHGGRDSGAVHMAADGTVDLTEKEVNLAIALKLAAMLRRDGYEVLLSHSSDTFIIPGASSAVELRARIDMANKAGADLYVAIHNNGLDNPEERGTEVWYCADRDFAGQNKRLADLTRQALVRNLRQAGYETVDRGIKDDRRMGHFAVIGPRFARPSRMPGIIGESLFLSNDQDAAILGREDMRQAIARGYLEGIRAYFAGE